MKKYLLAISAALLSVAAVAQKSSDVRIYLNAGHGSWGPNDRPMPTIPYPKLSTTGRPDTCGFYESNTNLWKILKLGETLEKMGVTHSNIMYSRRKNGPYPYVAGAADEEKYNRSLSEISAEVEANNMDMFISIHSNAAAEGALVNYPLILYRGNDGDGGDLAKGSRDMSKAIWGPHFMSEIDPQTAFSSTSMNLRGDLDFYHGDYPVTNSYSHITYHGYLGVLKHGVPGFLLEGFFHTYQPARHRALNKDYCGQEGVRVARGVCSYFSLTPETTGYIMGTVKDMHEKIVNDLYHYIAGSVDQWLPVNGAKVLLIQGSDTVATYQVDKNYNGVFVFEGLKPGSYTLQVQAKGYKPLSGDYTKPITVKANETSYTNLLVEKASYTPPVIEYENYPTPEQPKYLGVPEQFKMTRTTKYYTSLSGTIKRVIFRGDSAVALTENAGTPHLYLINLKNNVIARSISVSGITAKDAANAGDYSALSDIAFTADGKLVGINKVLCQYSDAQVDAGYKRGTLRLYLWDTFASSPKLWVSTASSANFYRAVMGGALTVSGKSADCKVITTAVTASDSKGMRMLCLNINSGTVTSEVFTEKNISGGNFSESRQGNNITLNVSPRADSLFVIDGENTLPAEFLPAAISNTDSRFTSIMTESENDSIGATATGINFLKYGGRRLMVTPYMKSGKYAGLKLYDITDGLNGAKAVTVNCDAPATAADLYTATGSTVSGKDLTLYFVTGRKFTKFTTRGITQPLSAGMTASGLKVAQSDDGSAFTFAFHTVSRPTAAAIILYDAATGEKRDSIPVATLKSGDNSVSIPLATLGLKDGEKLKWALRLTGSRVTDIVKLNPSETSSYTHAFSTLDDDADSPYFGNIYVYDFVSAGNTSNGLYSYSPLYARANSSPYGAGTLKMGYRLASGEGGRLYLPDYSNDHPGVFVMKMPDTGTFTQFFKGARTTTGLIVRSGVKVGSSAPATALRDGKLYVLLEDMDNAVGVYDIGHGTSAASTWGTAPSKLISTGGLLANGNCSIVPDPLHGGLWVSQVRYKSNNTASVPSLIYLDTAGNVLFNSGSEDFMPYLNGSPGAGFAVSRQSDMLAMADADGAIQFYSIAWSTATPKLTPLWSYSPDIVNSSDHNAVYQMTFDRGNNLICSGSKLGVYTVPREVNSTLIPAPSSSEVVNAVSSVKAAGKPALSWDAVSAEVKIGGSAKAEIRVYDTAGAEVKRATGPSLSLRDLPRGVYIIKSGSLTPLKVTLK